MSSQRRHTDSPGVSRAGTSAALSPMAVAASTIDLEYARACVHLAALGPANDPNPRVGCVLLDAEGRVAGTGFHRGAGTPHAEAAALADARGAHAPVRGGTAYVSLEPCDHVGRTGPCSVALIEAGIARVVILTVDSNPRAAGGAARLRHAGLQVDLLGLPAHDQDVGSHAVRHENVASQADAIVAEAARLNRWWRFAVENERPFVTWKFAATLDGRSAASDGSSQWITGEPARADVHRLRAEAGAVLIGTGTALTDNPRLTVRGPDGTPSGPQPLRVVMGESALPPQAQLLRSDGSAEPALQLRTRDPREALTALHEHEIRHVWLEGGPTLAAAFARAGLIDRIIAYVAPALLGAGRSAVADLGIESMADIARWDLSEVARVGDDLRLTLTPLANCDTDHAESTRKGSANPTFTNRKTEKEH